MSHLSIVRVLPPRWENFALFRSLVRLFVRFIQTWVRDYFCHSTRRDGCKVLKFSLQKQIFFGGGVSNFWVPPPKKKNCWPYKFFGQKWKKSKLFKIAWNGEKIGWKWFFLTFESPPPKKVVRRTNTKNVKYPRDVSKQSQRRFTRLYFKQMIEWFFTFADTIHSYTVIYIPLTLNNDDSNDKDSNNIISKN